jgi:hypothetical protein
VTLGLELLTIVHVALSLLGIAAGAVVAYGFIRGKRLDVWAAVFLSTTAATSLTGFLFPVDHFTPGLALGILSLLVLGPAIFARYGRHLAGPWRPVYVIGSLVALYFNVFVLIAQSFLKVPALRTLAPTQSEPPFAVTQLAALAAFVGIGILAVRRFRAAANSEDAAPTAIDARAAHTQRAHEPSSP